MMKKGFLKRKVSILRGYQEKWFVLEVSGFLKQYDKIPYQQEADVPNWKMNVILADIEKKKDGLQFVIISNEGQKVKLKADSSEQRDEWIICCYKITNRQFPLLHKYALEKATKATAIVPAPSSGSQTQLFTPESLPGDSSRVSSKQKPKLLPKEPSFKEVNNDSDTVDEEDKPEELREDILNNFKDMPIVSKRNNKLMVAAIDFGSAYSGCAFSFKAAFKRNPLEICTMALETSGCESLKVPTILLLDPDGNFKAFGSEAEEKYVELLQQEPENSKNYYYFSRFKMQLYNNTGERTCGPTTGGRRALGVPAIWNEAARQFMIDAAEKAGIDPESLTLALEPEAAALCCKCLQIEKQKQGQEACLRSFETGSRFLIVDLGGGTVDITSNEVLETGQLKEIYNASGGPWGGNTINAQFWGFFRELFGSDVVEEFIENNTDDYLDMAKRIELKKRSATIRKRITLDIPHSLFELIKKSNPAIISEKYIGIVQARGPKITIEPGLIYEIFKSGIDAICNYVQELLNKPETAGVSTILLVGGYASWDLLKNVVKERFKNLAIIRSLNSDLIVLKGAVIMGHMDTPIVGRMAKCHYGFAVVKEQLTVDRSFKPLTGTQEFITFIRKGEPIKVNDLISEYEIPIAFDQHEAFILIYASDDDEPPIKINDGNCRQIGHIQINLPRFRKNTTLKKPISNNETEFKVVATDEHTRRCFPGVCRFLN